MQIAVEDELPQPLRAVCTPFVFPFFSFAPLPAVMQRRPRRAVPCATLGRDAAIHFVICIGKRLLSAIDPLFFRTNMGGETVGIRRFQSFEGVE